MCRIGLFLATLALAGLAGCTGAKGPQTGRVSGRITLNGKPLAGANVNFDLKEGKSPRVATGVTDADGRYTLSTFGQNDGAVLGRHVVWITMPQKGEAIDPNNPTADYGKMMSGAAVGAKPDTGGVPAKYTSKETSDLSFEVKAGNNTADFDLK